MGDLFNRLRQYFPNLTENNACVTSPRNPYYNCVAWAVHATDSRWWPVPGVIYYWPLTRRVESVECFVSMFKSRQFEPCTDSAYEEGYEKIAIYAQGNAPKHVARQLPDGKWTSKLGSDEDICHNTLDVLEGGDYGDVVQLMKRKL